MIPMRIVSHVSYDTCRLCSPIMLDYTRYYEQLQNRQHQSSLEKTDEASSKVISGEPIESEMHEVSVDE
jgi:hypothetical protein